MPLFMIKRLARSHTKTLGFVPAEDGVAALVAWGGRGLVPGDWLQAERVYGFADGDADDVTEAPRVPRQQLAPNNRPRESP